MGILGLAPLTGLPLPFFSYGGSAYISLMAAMAIVLKISAENRKTYA
jgi:cell division protein FtsW